MPIYEVRVLDYDQACLNTRSKYVPRRMSKRMSEHMPARLAYRAGRERPLRELLEERRERLAERALDRAARPFERVRRRRVRQPAFVFFVQKDYVVMAYVVMA